MLTSLAKNYPKTKNIIECSVISNWIMAMILCIFLLFFIPKIAQAIELNDDIKLHGFLTQGYFLTSDNRIFGTSDSEGSFDFTEAGLNASWTPNADFRLAAQVLFRRAGIGHENDFELDFGLLDYTFLSAADHRLGARIGRVKIPYGFYNDTRDVIFTRPTILLPQSIYPDRTRNLSLSADGGLVYGEYRNELGTLSLELGGGILRSADLDTELAILGFDFPGSTYSEPSYIGRLSYDLEGGRYRIAITSARMNTRYDPMLFPPKDLTAGKFIFKPFIFSAQYNTERLSFTTEYAIRHSERTGFGDRFDISLTGESYYLQTQYRFDENWQAIIRYDVLYNNNDDKNGQKYQALTGRPNHTQFAKDWTFGLRYYVDSSFLIAAEYHYVNGTAWLPIQDNPDPNSLEQRWHMFSLAASYRF